MHNTLFPMPVSQIERFIPYDYQLTDKREFVRLVDSGIRGVLTRCFTGGGKTLMTCFKFQDWLDRGENYRCMVLSYEQTLVEQFAQEIYDAMRIEPAIEMNSEAVEFGDVPKIVVASRQSLLQRKNASEDQLAKLKDFGVDSDGVITASDAKSMIRRLSKREVSPEEVVQAIEEFQYHWSCNREVGAVSRVYKFDPKYNWLIACDEAHKFALQLASVGHLWEWFNQNELTRWTGMTATPKRSDGVSIGSKMFQGISLDYPLFVPEGPCAIRDGYAVPYLQKYISVEGVDFRAISRTKGDFDEAELERVLGTEAQLAKLIDPMLDICGERRTLIFSPGVQMAKDVAAYINARVPCCCLCGIRKWYARMLIGDGATCQCGALIDDNAVINDKDQAQSVWGEIPAKQRRTVYEAHQSGKFQFLSVCGLCKEGYNDPDISCVTIFRPVSKAASSLAEQMKGRSARALRGLLRGLNTAEERLAAIAASSKPNALIIDLVGVTGLADCASTVQIYAEGLDDEIADRAQELIDDGDEDNVAEAIYRAKEEIAEEREKIKQARLAEEARAKEEAEKRAKAQAEVKYTTHDTGQGSTAYDPSRPSDKMMGFIGFLGMSFDGWEPSRKQCHRIIGLLKEEGKTPQETAYACGIKDSQWSFVGASGKQVIALRRMGYKGSTEGMTKAKASGLFDQFKGKSPPPPPRQEQSYNDPLDDINRRLQSGDF